MQHRVKTRLQVGVFPPLGTVEGRATDGKCEPVVDVRLHQRPVFSPLFPSARGNMRDVASVARCSTLEVVTADERWAWARSLQHEEASEQPHRWLYPHVHLAEVNENGHQSDGVGRKMLQLEPIVLQQREEGG
jgi:hypothetical protein